MLLGCPLLQSKRFALIFQTGKLVIQGFLFLCQLLLSPPQFRAFVLIVRFDFSPQPKRFFAGLNQQFFLPGLGLPLKFFPFRFYFRTFSVSFFALWF